MPSRVNINLKKVVKEAGIIKLVLQSINLLYRKKKNNGLCIKETQVEPQAEKSSENGV